MMQPKTSTSKQVIEAIADRNNVDPLDLETPLCNAIDPDALNSLFEPAFGDGLRSGKVQFEHSGYRVTVISDSETDISIDLSPVDEPTTTDPSASVTDVNTV